MLKQLSTAVIALFAGLSIGLIFYSRTNTVLDSTISIGEIANLFFVIVVAIFVALLNKQINSKRMEKDIYIDQCSELVQELYHMRELVEEAHLKEDRLNKSFANKIVLRIRTVSNRLANLESGIKDVYKHESISKLLVQLTHTQRQFWSDLTVNLKDERPQISSETYIRSERQLFKYLADLSKLIAQINNS